MTNQLVMSPNHLHKLETLFRQAFFMPSYLDWAVDGAPSDIFDSYLAVTQLSSDLVPLLGFVGEIIEDLFTTLINVAGHTTNM
jgi:hypothetical protein